MQIGRRKEFLKLIFRMLAPRQSEELWVVCVYIAENGAELLVRMRFSNFNGSLGSGYFLYVMNERTTYASCAPAFESSGLI